MALRVPLTQYLFLVTSCAGVMGASLGPGDACTFNGLGFLVKHPHDCHKFYVCEMGLNMLPHISKVPRTCPAEFDCFVEGAAGATGYCVIEDAGSPKCDVAGVCKDQIPQHNVCETSSCIGVDIGNLIYDVHNCSNYKMCLGPSAVPLPCPNDKPYFNGEYDGTNEICVADETKCCKCQPRECGSSYDVKPDPFNCKQYYSCLAISRTGHYVLNGPTNCPSDGFFDSVTGKCVPSDTGCPHTPTCELGIDTTTTTTTAKTTTTDDGCLNVDDYECPPDAGLYPLCPNFCDKHFVECDSTGNAKFHECNGDAVFPIDGSTQHCVHPEDCVAPF